MIKKYKIALVTLCCIYSCRKKNTMITDTIETVSFIFIGVNFQGLAETEIFVEI